MCPTLASSFALACSLALATHLCFLVTRLWGVGRSESPLWAAATGPGLFRSLGFKTPVGTGFFGGQHTATQVGVWAAPGRLHVQSVCALVHTGWPGGVGGGWVYLWSGLWPCTPHVLETLAEFLPLQSHCGVRPPRPGVVNPSGHGAR